MELFHGQQRVTGEHKDRNAEHSAYLRLGIYWAR